MMGGGGGGGEETTKRIDFNDKNNKRIEIDDGGDNQ